MLQYIVFNNVSVTAKFHSIRLVWLPQGFIATKIQMLSDWCWRDICMTICNFQRQNIRWGNFICPPLPGLMSKSNLTVFHLILYISSFIFPVTFGSDWLTKTFWKLFCASKKFHHISRYSVPTLDLKNLLWDIWLMKGSVVGDATC